MRTRMTVVLAALAGFALARAAVSEGEAEKPAKAVEPPVCLLTGFEPFGGAPLNASWEAVKAFEGTTVAGHRVVTALLPVVYDEMERPLLAAVEKHRPRLVLCFGVGSPVVQVERTARNAYHPGKPKDNRDNPPPRERIVAEGPAEIPTALPVDEILAALAKAKIGARSSTDAGGYLCNECFYRLMRLDRPGIVRRGFVHVPAIGQRDPLGGTFSLERLRAAVRVAIEVTAADAAAKPGTQKGKEEEAKPREPPGR